MIEDNLLDQKAWVVFSGKADVPWLRLLKPGFRHCFVIINDGERWLTLEPLLNYMDVRIHHNVPADFDLPTWLARRGQVVVSAQLDRDRETPAPIMLFTCVEAVKRVLGMHHRGIFTPWQLYRYLKKHNGVVQKRNVKKSRFKNPAPVIFSPSSLLKGESHGKFKFSS